MSGALLISEAVDADLETVVALWEVCGLTRPWNDPRADFRLACAGETSTVLAGRAGAEIIATVMVGFDGHRGWIYYLAVDPAARPLYLYDGLAVPRSLDRGFEHLP